MPDDITVTITISSETHAELMRLATIEHRTIGEIIDALVAAHRR